MRIKFPKSDFIYNSPINGPVRMLTCFGNVCCNELMEKHCKKCWTECLPNLNEKGLFIPDEFVEIAKDHLYEYKSVYYTPEDWKRLKTNLKKGGYYNGREND